MYQRLLRGVFLPYYRRHESRGDNAQKTASPEQDMSGLRPPVQLAPQMEEGLGVGQILLEALPREALRACLRVLKPGGLPTR